MGFREPSGGLANTLLQQERGEHNVYVWACVGVFRGPLDRCRPAVQAGRSAPLAVRIRNVKQILGITNGLTVGHAIHLGLSEIILCIGFFKKYIVTLA